MRVTIPWIMRRYVMTTLMHFNHFISTILNDKSIWLSNNAALIMWPSSGLQYVLWNPSVGVKIASYNSKVPSLKLLITIYSFYGKILFGVSSKILSANITYFPINIPLCIMHYVFKWSINFITWIEISNIPISEL